MFSYIKGNLEVKSNDFIVIDVNGIGFKIFMSENAINKLEDIGKVVKVYTYMNVREDDKEFLANFYKYSFVGLTLEWINNDMRQDPELIIRKLDKAIKGNIKAALKRYETF